MYRHPERHNAYVSYGITFAEGRSRVCHAYARRQGVQLNELVQRADEWWLAGGGSFRATGIGGGLTGSPVSGILAIDDPHKDREAAESVGQRDKVEDWFWSVAMPRVHPGASVFVVHTRWHEDDLIGRLAKKRGWTHLNLPAINDGTDPRRAIGEALWPAGRPLSFLEDRRETTPEYDWLSLYMGMPRRRGGNVFHGVTYYDELPKTYRVGKGLDLAYTESTRADHSVGVSLLEDEGLYYVVSVVREQLELDNFLPFLRKQTASFPGMYRFYSSGTEKGIAQLSKLLRNEDIRINAVLAMQDKFTRAQPVATFWNRKKVLVPSPKACKALQEMGLDTSWVQAFIREMERFTGVSDPEDDQVDAIAAAFDAIPRRKPAATPGEVATYESPMGGF